MHADELRQAVTKVVGILKRSDIRGALDRYRAAKGDDRTAAAARLGHAGTMIMERMEGLSPAERRVARLMHLESLGSPDYWQSLLGGASDPKTHQAEIVRLASRVMFSTGQLPALIALLETVAGERSLPTPADGESRLTIRLADAGEKASDPDRIARSIDGIDMLYSACASIARKPATDLRLDGVEGSTHRDIRFTGERESLSAVIAVIESIPAALADIDPDGEIDLEAIVGSLPVFEDLRTLGSLGTFSANDLKDISETMYQGALLTLESGVMLVEQPPRHESPGRGRSGPTGSANEATNSPARSPAAGVQAAGPSVAAAPGSPVSSTEPSVASPRGSETTDSINEVATLPTPFKGSVPANEPVPTNVADEGDRHYEHYLREREAMRKTSLAGGGAGDAAGQRRNAVEELLRSLEQSRNG